MNTNQSIINWFEAAKPKPTLDDLCVQIGCHLEEIKEMLEALNLNIEANYVRYQSNRFKQKLPYAKNKIKELIAEKKQVDFIDSIADQHVTGLGILKFLKELEITNDDLGLLREVNESNWSKFDEEGLPFFDENGKIKKGPDYFAPDLQKFIVGSGG